MRRPCRYFIILITLLGLSAGSARSESPTTAPSLVARSVATYTNPVALNLPDPFVIRHDGVYYAYGTNAPGEGYRVLSSPDLVHWQDRGFCFHKTDRSWGRENFWAPCVLEKDHSFYLFYSSMGKVGPDGSRMSHRISVAKSDSPLGPFVDLKAPLLDIGKATIDAHAFIDDDGRAYLYYALDCSENKISELYVVPLSDDLTQVTGSPVFCTRPDTPWEGDTWNEAPFVFKHKNTYIMMYSARGFFDPLYSLGYATSKSPLGPFTKASENPILKKTQAVSGPGHNAVIASPDGKELFCAYHIHHKLEGGHERDLAIDRMIITDMPDGSVRLRINGPTRTPQPMPSGAAELAEVK
jgi:beta-xylosidase